MYHNQRIESEVKTMDALEYRVKQALKSIAREAFPEKSHMDDFELEVLHDYTTSFHGQYKVDQDGTCRIRISNLDREPRKVIATAIHELSHHLCHLMTDDLEHDKTFYTMYHHLLETACIMGIITPELIGAGFEDESSTAKMLRTIGPITATADPDKAYMKDYRLILVGNTYDAKESLKNRKYFYNSRSKMWEKAVKKDSVDAELQELRSIGTEPYVADSILDLTALYDIHVIGETYPIRQKLAELGYKFSKTKKLWYKRILSTDLAKEQKESIDQIEKYPGVKVEVIY